ELLTNSNYQEFGRYNEVDLSIAADGEATLPSLIEACRRLITPERKRVIDARGARLAEASRAAYEQTLDQAALGWDASPITTARLSMEIWHQIKTEDWSLVSEIFFVNNWPIRSWNMTKHHQYLGWARPY